MILLNSELQSKYEQDRNSLRLFAQENPRDRLQIEIGDTKDENLIQPQVKLLRFDNEYNYSIRLLHNEKETPKIQTDGNRLIWKAGTTEVRFYEKEKSEQLPGGGYEMDQIVNLQKSGNVFYYTLQTKGIDFIQQYELTEQEKLQGCKRPDFIIGGYVLYAKNNPINIEGGKEYRAGKIGEIHAPIITDSAGRFEKCGIIISAERGLMRIIVSDEFAQKAKNPCRLDPTLGYTTAGSSNMGVSEGWGVGSLYTKTAGEGRCSKITINCAVNNNTPVVKGIILKHSDYAIITNGIGSQATPGATQGMKDSNFAAGPQIQDGEDYIISVIVGNATGDASKIYYDSGASNQGHRFTIATYASPSTATEYDSDNHKYTIYATYTDVPKANFMPFFI